MRRKHLSTYLATIVRLWIRIASALPSEQDAKFLIKWLHAFSTEVCYQQENVGKKKKAAEI